MQTVLLLGVAAILSVAATSCASSAASRSAAAALASGAGEEIVTFRLVDAMISPTRIDGRPWDMATPLADPAARERVVTAMDHASDAKVAYESASAVLGRLDHSGGRPDVSGAASLDFGNGRPETREIEGGKDTLTPRFVAEWDHVPLTNWTSVRMYFVDKDGGREDDIGAVELSALDLAAALKDTGTVHHVRVDDQTNGQILFVGISVKSESRQ